MGPIGMNGDHEAPEYPLLNGESHTMVRKLDDGRSSLAAPAAITLLLVTAGIGGCATTQTNLTSARTLDQGEFEANVNGQVNLNSSPLRTGIAAGESIENEIENTPEDENVSEETARRAIDFAVASALFRPKPAAEGVFRAGLLDKPLGGLDAGLRYNGSTVKGDLKFQYWSSEDDAFAASIQPAFGYHSSTAPSAIEYITFTEWSRYDYDILAPFGFAYDEIARVWLAPRFMYSRIKASPKIDEFLKKRLPEEVENRRQDLFGDGENIFYAGLNVGGMVGYKYAYFALEASVSRVFFNPEILGETRNLSGFAIMPSAALVVQFP